MSEGTFHLHTFLLYTLTCSKFDLMVKLCHGFQERLFPFPANQPLFVKGPASKSAIPLVIPTLAMWNRLQMWRQGETQLLPKELT